MKELMGFDGGVEALSKNERCVNCLVNAVNVLESEKTINSVLLIVTGNKFFFLINLSVCLIN